VFAHAALRRVPAALLLTVTVGVARADELPPPASIPPLLAQSFATLLSDWIIHSRDSAIAQGVAPIPAGIRAALEGYVPASILERVRWRVGGGETSLQAQLFRFGYAPAVTFDHVVIFEREANALNDPKLWVHELRHVMQYAEWGVPDFAVRYVRDYEAVEREAAEYRWQWMKLTNRIPNTAQPAE
jgi:hypothetical protein